MVEENIVTKTLTEAATKNALDDTAKLKELKEASKPKGSMQEKIVAKAMTKAPNENRIIMLLKSTKETIMSKAPLEDHTGPKGPIRAEKAKEATLQTWRRSGA